jgi:hypothetical protein
MGGWAGVGQYIFLKACFKGFPKIYVSLRSMCGEQSENKNHLKYSLFSSLASIATFRGLLCLASCGS